MKARRVAPQLQHVAQRRQTTARRRAQNGQRRPHRGGIGVVALVDQRGGTARDSERASSAPTGECRDRGEAGRKRRCLEAQRLDDGQHRQRVHHPMPPGQRQREADADARPARRDVAALGAEIGVEQPPVRIAVLAEGENTRDPLALRMGEKPGELLAVTGQHGHTAGLQPFEDLGLGVGDGLDRAQIFEMRRGDPGHDGDVRPDLTCEIGDLASMVHAHLEDAEARRLWQAGQRQRHAPLIVVAGGAAVGRVRRPPAHGEAPPSCRSCRRCR